MINADGSGLLQLTDGGGGAPRWSPNGEKISFMSDRNNSEGLRDIFIMDADGGNVTQVTDVGVTNTHGVWAPSGNAIAFRADLDGDTEIYIATLGSSVIHQVTNNEILDAVFDWVP